MVGENSRFPLTLSLYLSPWSPGGTFMVHKMSLISPMPIFYGLNVSVSGVGEVETLVMRR